MVSGRIHVTTGTFTPRPSLLADLSLSLRLPLDELALPRRCTPWHVIPNVRHKPVGPCRSMSMRFQALLTPCQGFFSTFPHGTCTLSVLRRIYGWKLVSPNFLLRIRGAVLRILPQLASLSLRGCHPVSQHVPVHFAFASEA